MTITGATEANQAGDVETGLSRAHAVRLSWWVGLAIGVVMPLTLAVWIIASRIFDWDVVFTARAANVCGMVLLAVLLFGPLLFRRYPLDARLRGFVIVWFLVSPFFNLVWQLPLILFRSAITGAPVTADNLPAFISWWGYGSVDTHYGTVSSFMVASELWWLLAMGIGIVGLIRLLRGAQRPAYLLLLVSGALQAYNAGFYIVENGIVDHYDNVATDSFLGPLLYFGFGALWPTAAATAAIICYRFVNGRQ